MTTSEPISIWRIAGPYVGAISIVAVLAAIFYPIFAPPQTGHSRTPLSNLKQLAVAAQVYAEDHDDWFPKNPSLVAKTISGYRRDPAGFPFREQVSQRPDLESALYVYIKAPILISPVSKKIETDKFPDAKGLSWFNFAGSDFGWNDYELLKGINISTDKYQSVRLLSYQMEPLDYGTRPVVYLDGHAKVEDKTTFVKRLKAHRYWFIP